MKRILFLLLIGLSSNLVFAQDIIVETLTRQQTQEDSGLNNDNQDDYFTLGLGAGNSYGGLGLRIQYRRGGKHGFGIHAGVGYFPYAPIFTSVGVKFFLSRSFYLNTQFGFTGVIVEYYHTGFWTDYDVTYLYGPSFLVGGDWLWGRRRRFGLNAGFGIIYHINAEISPEMSPITPALDLGFVVRF